MNQVDGILILLFLPLALLLCGYWLAATLRDGTAMDRLAFAVLFGLAWMLAAVAAVNFFHPLSGLWAYACLLPGLPTLLPRNLAGLWQDIRTVCRARLVTIAVPLAAYLVLLLWPVMHTPASLFYDGTSNHDSFFWVAGAEHLKRHTYLELPERNPIQPLTATATAIIGWQPAWGRMGAEGLLALASSVIGASPLKLYLYATACLYFAWLAAAWLGLKTFVTDRPVPAVGIALVAFQPLFAFFYGNSNLPNLLGALLGATLIIAFERALRNRAAGRRESDAYLVLVALAFHGLLCCYPEMTPFVLMPAGLLWLRHWFKAGWRAGWWPCVLSGGAILLGLALNTATTVRAYHGFVASFTMARADENWANLFNPLELSEYAPALVSLSVTAARLLGPWLGWPLSVILLTATLMVLRRSRDWFGLVAAFSGSAALILYTIVTGFAYGWQKTVQFSGVFFGMVFPAAVVYALVTVSPDTSRTARRLGWLILLPLVGFMAFATAMNFRETYKWSDRKVISADWFALRDLTRTRFLQAPVLVEAATFRMAFFHGMWATYFLTESDIYYGMRGEESGGYLRGEVINEADQSIPPPAAFLVGRDWAETFDADSPRLLTGREFVLLSRSNRVLELRGVFPLNGPPDRAARSLALRLRPANPSTLRFTLTPPAGASPGEATWEILRRSDDGSEFSARLSGPPPWQFEVPLLARQNQSVTIAQADPAPDPEEYPFILSGLKIVRDPIPLSPTDGNLDFSRSASWEDYHMNGIDLSGRNGPAAGPQDAVFRFIAPPTDRDVLLQLVALPQNPRGRKAPLATELWFNDQLVFTGFFSEPGVLRARIIPGLWNQHPVGQIRLRFPGKPEAGTTLLLKSLTTRPPPPAGP